ncbi:MAG: hypothetical protein AAFW65_01235 [Pseudomonadota bacterium]
MTDTSPPIDEHRPWITDPADAPARMNWFKTLFNPFGQTSRLHFTRASTFLFFLTLPFAVMMFAGMFVPGIIGVGVVSLLSFIAHVRRLASAKRSPLWAGLVLLPIAVCLVVFSAVASANVSEANRISAQILADRADPVAARERQEAERQARAEAAEAEEGEGEARGRPDGPKPGFAKDGSFSPVKFLLDKAGPYASAAWAPFGLGVLLWTVFWVARLPNGGGPISSRFEERA